MSENALTTNTGYQGFLSRISAVYTTGQLQAHQAVNAHLTQTYWQIGHDIVEFEQGGQARAEYGKALLTNLSRDLSLRHGKGFSRSNVIYMRLLYLQYPKGQKPSDLLSWSHHVELLRIDDPLERSFYEKQAILEKWSIPELKRQKKKELRRELELTLQDAEAQQNLTAKMKKTLSTPRKRPASSQREPAPDPAFERIAEMVASLRAHHQQMALAYAPIVHDLIKRHCQNVQEIERALDRLLDIACIPEGLALFKSLCRYYYGIHPANTASYVRAYRAMWDSEQAQETHSGRESITRPAGAGPANPQKARATIRRNRIVKIERRLNP